MRGVKILIPATTAAVTSSPLQIKGAEVPATFVATGLAGTEKVYFETSLDNGATWYQINESGVPVSLNAGQTCQSAQAGILFRLVKDATVAAVAVGVFTTDGEGT